MRKKKQFIAWEIRLAVFERDHFTCRYCGDKKGPFHADHVYPESKGGETSVDNIVTACSDCNRRKHSKVGMWPKPIGYFEKRKKGPAPDVEIGLMAVIVGITAISFTITIRIIPNSFPLDPTIPEALGFLLVFLGAYMQYKGNSE